MEISKIAYFNEPGLSNTEKLLECAKERVQALEIEDVIIASNAGFTVRKALEVFHDIEVNMTVVTNSRGSEMPVSFLYEKYPKAKEFKEGLLKEGRKKFPISISEETQKEFEQKGIKVFFVPDILSIGGSLGPKNESRSVRTKLDPFLPKHLRPLDIEAGTDLSLLNIISMGFRVCVGITAVAMKNGLVPDKKMVLSVAGTGWAGGGADTAIIIQTNSNPKKCYVREIIGLPKNK